MRPESMDALFRALASASRRRILDILRRRPGCNVSRVAAFFDTSRIAVLKHLRVLEEAGLVHSEKSGRDRRLWFNAVPIQMIHDRWTSEFSALWAAGLTRLKYRLEAREENACRSPEKPSSRSSSAAGSTTSGAKSRRRTRSRSACST